MSKEDIPLQIGLFTGELTDTRTPAQKRSDRDREKPQQTEMFSQREIAQFGVQAHPLLPLSPHTKLVLISEDPRTEEEIEQDRERQAHTLTRPLFEAAKSPELVVNDPPPLSVNLIYSPAGLSEDATLGDEETDEDDDPPRSPLSPLSKLTIYFQLIHLCEERKETIDASKPMLLSQRIAMSVLTFEAKQAGLTIDEIQAAVTIGEYRAKWQKRDIQPIRTTTILASISFPQTGILWKRASETLLEMSKI